MIIAPFDAAAWTARRDDGEPGDTRRLFEVVRECGESAPLNAGEPLLIGFCCDEGVRRNQGRIGAARAPRALRRALAGLPAHRVPTLRDAGDIVCDDGDLEAAQRALGEAVRHALTSGARPVVLGGGHEVAWGTYCGLRAWLDDGSAGERHLLVVNFDAHFDLRQTRPGKIPARRSIRSRATARCVPRL